MDTKKGIVWDLQMNLEMRLSVALNSQMKKSNQQLGMQIENYKSEGKDL